MAVGRWRGYYFKLPGKWRLEDAEKAAEGEKAVKKVKAAKSAIEGPGY
jgi:hypothetical protein